MEHIHKLIIARDGWPLEQIKGRPITNFFRRLFLSDYVVCRDCWYAAQEAKTKQKLNQIKLK